MPSEFKNQNSWNIIGPLNPRFPSKLENFPCLTVDGGGNFITSDIWIGDRDSAQELKQSTYQFLLPQQKDKSDLALGLSLFESPREYRLFLYGFHGGRFDHELSNTGEILQFLKQNPRARVELRDAESKLRGYYGREVHEHDIQGLFSIFTLEPTGLKIEGDCEYQGEKLEFQPLSSHGLSNKGWGKIRILSDVSYIVIYGGVV